MGFEIVEAVAPHDLAACRALFREYQASLGIDLGYQDFEQELATLPGKYAPPRGRLLVARLGDELLGCGALRPLGDRDCEMKRLYVRPAARGTGLGRALAERLIAIAREQGHARMRLDTLPTMGSAQRLYEALGFGDTPPYYATPIAGTRFMALDLQRARPPTQRR